MSDPNPPHDPYSPQDPQQNPYPPPYPPQGPPYPQQSPHPPPYSQQKYPPAPPGGGQGPRRRRGKTVGIALAIVAVLAVGALVVTHLLASGGGTPSAGRPPTSPGRGPGGTCPAVDPDTNTTALEQSMTDAIEAHDRSAFVALAGTPTAKRAMGLWWDNASAVGFDAGAAYVDPSDSLSPSSTSHTDQRVFTIGLHNPLDPVDPKSDVIDKPEMHTATTTYRLTLAAGGAGCKSLTVTNWLSLWNTPLDVSSHLYVVKEANVVVAGEQAMKTEIDRIAPVAEKAAKWDIGFFENQQGKHTYVVQKGFVLYVPTTDQQALGWFRAPTAPKPHGWTADAASTAGIDFPLPSVNTAASVKTKTAFDDGGSGASRVIVTKTGRSESPTAAEGVLVHEFTHDLLDVNAVWVWATGTPIPAAIVEGAARWVESYFYSNTACDCKNRQGNWPSALPHLRQQVQTHLSSFNGRIPTDAQVYGSSATANYYYALSASAFDWIAQQNDASFALQTVVNDYLGQNNPFSGVITKIKGGTIYFADPATLQPKWAAWVRSGMSSS